MSDLNKGYLLGLAGVIIFGLTLPATRIAMAEFPAIFVGLGRALVAAAIAALCLAATRSRLPRRDQLSQFLGFFFWNTGLALGGVAKVGQMQLFQVFVTLAASALVLGEAIKPVTLVFALLVVAAVAAGRNMRVERKS